VVVSGFGNGLRLLLGIMGDTTVDRRRAHGYLSSGNAPR
jgi:hypothetical protein